MPVKPSKKLEILQRRQRVADLYLQGWTQHAIAAELKCSQPCVSEDLTEIRQEWLASSIRDFDLARAEELQKLDRIEREVWAAWDRSQKPSQLAVVTGESGKQQTRRTVKNQHGDPRFLELVHKCIAQRRAILGLDMGPPDQGDEIDGGITLEVRRNRVIGLFAALRQRGGTAAVGTGPGLIVPGDVCGGDQRRALEDGPALGLPRPDLDGGPR